jgi:hypothetical protein
VDIPPANTVSVDLPSGATNSKASVLEDPVVIGGSKFPVPPVVVRVNEVGVIVVVDE